MNYVKVPPTEKQLAFISVIVGECGPPWFKGKTKAEASAYIGSRMVELNSLPKEYEASMDDWENEWPSD